MTKKEFLKRVKKCKMLPSKGEGVCFAISENIDGDGSLRGPAVAQFRDWYETRGFSETGNYLSFWLYKYDEDTKDTLKRRQRYFRLFVNRCLRNKTYKKF